MSGFGGAWSESKLKCIEEYASAYLSVMQNQSQWQLHYVDAFAGSGRQELKGVRSDSGGETVFGDLEDFAETKLFLEGSAMRALRVSESAVRGFDRHIFVDKDEKACSGLAERIATEFPDLLPLSSCDQADANDFLLQYVQAQDWSKTRALVFLDPYDTAVSWSTVEALALTQACDVWYLFPLGIMRMLTNSGEIPEAWERRLNEVLGTEEWRDHFYTSVHQETLFGPEDVTFRDVSVERVVDYVVARLESCFEGVSKPGILRNTKNSPMFMLVMGIANPSLKAQAHAKSIANHLTKGLSQQ